MGQLANPCSPGERPLKSRWWCKLVTEVLINVLSVVNGSTHKECPCGIWSCIGAVVQCLTDKPVYHRKHYIYLISCLHCHMLLLVLSYCCSLVEICKIRVTDHELSIPINCEVKISIAIGLLRLSSQFS